jgi:hypothetical protein
MYSISSVARSLFEEYPGFRLDHLSPASCTHTVLCAELDGLMKSGNGLLTYREMGRSTEGRSINLVTVGSGPRKVMLWSQMHGDESTATLALLDILHFLTKEHRLPWVAETLRSLSIHCIPMVNPDGAERRLRHNAVGIDINRDARSLVTPEAHVLRDMHRKIAPEFGFNLHDQDLRSVGDAPHVAALALLAPPLDVQRSIPPTRLRAMRVGALITQALQPFVHGHIARYEDAFEPRAFGDLFQSLGTSTLLIESGHWPGDPEKRMIRKLNVVGLLSGLLSIALGSYEDADLDLYANLPLNGKRMFDLLIRGLELRHRSGWTGPVDLGVLFERYSDRATITEIGDLRMYGGLEVHTLRNRVLPPELATIESTVQRRVIYDLLQIYTVPPATHS